MVWLRARIEVPHPDVPVETSFWTGVTGGELPPYLSVHPSEPSGTDAPGLGVTVVVERDAPVPPASAPASFPGVRRSRVYQVCVDLPGARFEEQAQAWAARVGGHLEVLERRSEFAWVRMSGGPQPLTLLVQRLDRPEGPASAHLDVGTSDRAAEVRRHLALGAAVVAEEEFWTVLADPAGLVYCVTDRDPATGELTG